MKTKHRRANVFGTGGKTPFEDFLFLLVLSLAMAVSFFAKKQLAERFAMAERSQNTESVPREVHESLPVLELGESDSVRFQSVVYSDREQLLHHLGQSPSTPNSNWQVTGILLRVAYGRPWGEVKELEDRITGLGIDIYTEWEKSE